MVFALFWLPWLVLVALYWLLVLFLRLVTFLVVFALSLGLLGLRRLPAARGPSGDAET